MNPEELNRIARHEAGHILVARHEGFQTNDIIITAAGGQAGSNARLPDAPIMEYASRRLRVLLGGVVAQCLDAPQGVPQCITCSIKKVDASSDWERAEEIMRFLAHDHIYHDNGGGVDPNDELRRISIEYFSYVQKILETNREILEEITKFVLSKVNSSDLMALAYPPPNRAIVIFDQEMQSYLSRVRNVPFPEAGKR